MRVWKTDMGVAFKFERPDWQSHRARRFLAEFKYIMPRPVWNYDPFEKTWHVDEAWVDVFDGLRSKYFTEATQQALFALA
jgi:hypothetical protein